MNVDELEGATAESGSGLDMAAAVDEIGAGLGLGEPQDEGEGEEGTGEATPPAEPAAPAPSPKPATTPAGLTTNNPAGPPRAPSPDQPPSTWREGPKAKWAALDPEVRAEIVKREDDFFKGIEGYKADASVGKQLNQILEPYREVLQHYGVDAMQEIRDLLSAHHALATGTPAMQLQMFRSLMKEYKIDPAQLTAEPQYQSPEVSSLQQRLDALESSQAQERARQASERATQLRSEIAAFAADPANQYFPELANDIAMLFRSGMVKDLKEAYDKALWINPAVRQKELDRQQAEKLQAEEAKRKETLAKAKKAAEAKVKTASQGRGGTASLGSMDDTLTSTLREIRERDS